MVWTDEGAYLDRYAEPDKGWTDRDPARWSAPYWWVDAGMGAMAALLAAVDHGLGACFFGVPAARTGGRAPAVRGPFGRASGRRDQRRLSRAGEGCSAEPATPTATETR